MIYGTVLWPLSRAGRRAGGGGAVWRQRGDRDPLRQLVLAHGTPAAKPQDGNRRTPKIEGHAAFLLATIKQQPDPTLAELREMLAARRVSVSIATLWRFFARHGITRKKRPVTRRSRIVPTS